MKKIILSLAICFCVPVFVAADENSAQVFTVAETQWEKKSFEIDVNCAPVKIEDISVKENTAESIKEAEKQ